MSLTGAMSCGTRDVDHHSAPRAGFHRLDRLDGANLYHDAHFGLGLTMHRGTPFADDVELREKAVVRIYDIFFDLRGAAVDRRLIREVSAGPEFQRPMSTAGVHYLLGATSSSREGAGISRKSVAAWRTSAAVPMYTSSPGDSSIG